MTSRRRCLVTKVRETSRVMSRLRRRSLFRADTLTTLPLSQRGSAADTQQVDDEHERVVALDVDLRVALLAVAVLRRDHQHHAAADLLAREPLDPALDQAGVGELEGRG